jgi:hypothetical protein
MRSFNLSELLQPKTLGQDVFRSLSLLGLSILATVAYGQATSPSGEHVWLPWLVVLILSSALLALILIGSAVSRRTTEEPSQAERNDSALERFLSCLREFASNEYRQFQEVAHGGNQEDGIWLIGWFIPRIITGPVDDPQLMAATRHNDFVVFAHNGTNGLPDGLARCYTAIMLLPNIRVLACLGAGVVLSSRKRAKGDPAPESSVARSGIQLVGHRIPIINPTFGPNPAESAPESFVPDFFIDVQGTPIEDPESAIASSPILQALRGFMTEYINTHGPSKTEATLVFFLPE